MDSKDEDINELLRKPSLNSLIELAHQVVSRICLNKSLSYEAYSNIWSLLEWWSVTSFIEDTLVNSCKKGLSSEEIRNNLETVSDDFKQVIVDVYSARRDELNHHLLEKTSEISKTVLTDFDWQMKLIMASDKLSSIQEPLLNVDLQTKDATNSEKVVSLELSKADLKKLISSLDGASKALQQLTT